MKTRKNKGRKLSSEEPPSLIASIVREIFFKHWLLTLLIFVMVISSMQKARISHDARRAIAELQLLKDKSQKLQIEWQSLKLEMTFLSESNRVTQLAKKELGMKAVDSNNEKIISL